MRNTTLFIAMSLDGFIADRENGVGWLEGQDPAAETADFYGEFIRNADDVVMGWNTYYQVAAQLSPDRWPYEGMTCHVVTHRPVPSAYGIRFVREDPCALVRRLRQEPGRDIWICGGAEIAQALLREDLIDRLQLSVIPVLLGGGLRLFGPQALRLRLCSSRASNGIVELVYERRDAPGEARST